MKQDVKIFDIEDPLWALTGEEIAQFPDDKVYSSQKNLTVLSPRHPVSLKQLANMDPEKLSDYAIALTAQNSCLKTKAERDLLTGVLNRGTIDDMVKKSIARSFRSEHAVYVALSDIDNFKSFNDTYGHQVGDSVLIDTSNLVSRSLREEDIFGRYGGEEFVLVFNNGITADDVEKIVNEKREMIASYELNDPKYGSPRITASFGVANSYESPECVALCANPNDNTRGNIRSVQDIMDATEHTTAQTKLFTLDEINTANRIYEMARSEASKKLERTPENGEVANHIEANKYGLARNFLYKLADERLYQAKEAGKNCVIMR